jgi:protein-tyrosine phosphatase
MNITTIIDLRSDGEILRRPSALRDVQGFEYYHCAIYGNGEVAKSQEDVSVSYFEMIDEQKAIKDILKVIANAKKSVLYHCTAGKDRTGVLSAVLLMIAGVSKYDIFADYLVSGAYLREFIKNAERDNPEFAKIITPKVSYIEKFIDMFIEKYKSAEEYCRVIGLTEAEIEMIRNKLLKD